MRNEFVIYNRCYSGENFSYFLFGSSPSCWNLILWISFRLICIFVINGSAIISIFINYNIPTLFPPLMRQLYYPTVRKHHLLIYYLLPAFVYFAINSSRIYLLLNVYNLSLINEVRWVFDFYSASSFKNIKLVYGVKNKYKYPLLMKYFIMLKIFLQSKTCRAFMFVSNITH